jgi:hypothetical protein
MSNFLKTKIIATRLTPNTNFLIGQNNKVLLNSPLANLALNYFKSLVTDMSIDPDSRAMVIDLLSLLKKSAPLPELKNRARSITQAAIQYEENVHVVRQVPNDQLGLVSEQGSYNLKVNPSAQLSIEMTQMLFRNHYHPLSDPWEITMDNTVKSVVFAKSPSGEGVIVSLSGKTLKKENSIHSFAYTATPGNIPLAVSMLIEKIILRSKKGRSTFTQISFPKELFEKTQVLLMAYYGQLVKDLSEERLQTLTEKKHQLSELINYYQFQIDGLGRQHLDMSQ